MLIKKMVNVCIVCLSNLPLKWLIIKFFISGEETTKKVSSMNYYAYRLMIRQNADNYLLRFRRLFQQYCVDMYVKIETERLTFIRLNQAKLRSEEYIH